MAAQRFGATPEAWDHFAITLKLVDDLLPVVSNPNAAISDASKMQALGKTPSLYNSSGKVVGIPKWTKAISNEHLVQRWAMEADYGICIQTRKIRAFDIDVEDEAKAQAIAIAIQSTTGFALPERSRPNSGKVLLAFTYNRPLTKRVVPVDGGMIEILADGQQFIAEGTHPSGERYSWGTLNGQPRLPKAFPVLTGEQFDAVWQMLTTMFATGEPRIAREKREGTSLADIPIHDDVADWLLENWETYDVGRDGQIYIDCPFSADHTTDSGPTATAYFPAGTGGYAQGHFVCLHAHCAGRPDRDFLDASGYSLAQFQDLGAYVETPDVPRPADDADPYGADDDGVVERPDLLPASHPSSSFHWPAMVRKAGKIEPTAENIFNACRQGSMIQRRIAYDAFTDNLVWCKMTDIKGEEKWRVFTDADMVAVRIQLEQRGFKPMSVELLRSSVHAAAGRNAIDTAMRWLCRLEWDGVSRIDNFAVDCWGWEDSEYSRAVGRYTWTAMAGRVLQPGVRADMAPILVGLQGIKKTTAIQAMVPSEDMYAEIKLDDRDDDLSRKLRGKLIGELEELRGLNSRALEEIKAFVSRRRETWVPKYKEFETFFWRRAILVGSTNEDEILADPTGERRWLPGLSTKLDVERIRETRNQLWAEGAAMFLLDGVAWEDAERLAKIEHRKFKVTDSWERAIMTWLRTPQGIDDATLPMDKGHVSAGEIMREVLGLSVGQQNRTHEARVARAMKHLGFRQSEVTDEGYTAKVFTK